jgi:hypothetical protein
MTRLGGNVFTNPANGQTYVWPINHDAEEAFGKTREIEHTAPTSGIGLLRQQGDDQPLVIKLAGTILTKAQRDAMVAWYELCEGQTIYWTDFAGESYEVLITEFSPIRKRAARNMRDPVGAPLWFWTYSLSMEVITTRVGVWNP